MPAHPRAILALVLLAAATVPAAGGELDELRAENHRLQARVAELEKENARLRETGDSPLVAALEAKAAAAVHSEGDGPDAVLTTDGIRLETSSGPRSRHWISLRARPAAPDPVDLVVDAAASGRTYRTVESLELEIDGTREELVVVRVDARSLAPTRGTPGTGAGSETVTTALPRATLARLAEARSAGGVLGPTRFRFSPDQLAAFRAVDQRLDAAR